MLRRHQPSLVTSMTTYENICKVASNAVNKNKSVKFNDNVEKVEYE